MTDEERAREIASYLGHSHEVRSRFMKMIAGHFSAIRADQREKDAGIAECSYDDRSRVQSGNIDWDDGHRQGTRDAAAAIRAMGDKG